ncbi:MAG: hypothetical protein OIF47_08245 [Marinibacterium sp.]|nr:hypothetical protein [Marinibacterium sp.]
MIRPATCLAPIALMIATAMPALAQTPSRDEVCGNMSKVVSAIQQARLDKVKERDVSQTILASNPPWPERYNAAIVHMTPWVYEQKRRTLRNQDLGAAWNEVCQDNWQQMAELFK